MREWVFVYGCGYLYRQVQGVRASYSQRSSTLGYNPYINFHLDAVVIFGSVLLDTEGEVRVCTCI